MNSHFRLCVRWTGAAVLAAVAALLLPSAPARAQSTTPVAAEPQPIIQDNSFLLEEAYNQDPGSVQHSSTLARFWNSKDWVFTFSQDWPIPHLPRHQFTLSTAAVRTGNFAGAGPGFGDISLSYRYQLVGSSASRFAFAPRLSILLPSGRPRLGRGAGGVGFQTWLPASVVLNRRVNTHVNLGLTHTHRARNEFGDRASTTSYTVAHSLVYMAHLRLNLLLETVWNNSAEIVAPSVTRRVNDVLISPGIRWSYNFPSGLQIVPGVAVPLGVGPGAGERGLLFYLSFEYDMWDAP